MTLGSTRCRNVGPPMTAKRLVMPSLVVPGVRMFVVRPAVATWQYQPPLATCILTYVCCLRDIDADADDSTCTPLVVACPAAVPSGSQATAITADACAGVGPAGSCTCVHHLPCARLSVCDLKLTLRRASTCRYAVDENNVPSCTYRPAHTSYQPGGGGR